MDKIQQFLEKKKTYLALIATVVGILVSLADGDLTTTQAVLSIGAAVVALFAKAGHLRTEKKIEELMEKKKT